MIEYEGFFLNSEDYNFIKDIKRKKQIKLTPQLKDMNNNQNNSFIVNDGFIISLSLDFEIDKLPSSIKKLKNLNDLHISSSILKGFPYEITHLTSLENLWLNVPDSFKIPESIESLKKLKRHPKNNFRDALLFLKKSVRQP